MCALCVCLCAWAHIKCILLQAQLTPQRTHITILNACTCHVAAIVRQTHKKKGCPPHRPTNRQCARASIISRLHVSRTRRDAFLQLSVPRDGVPLCPMRARISSYISRIFTCTKRRSCRANATTVKKSDLFSRFGAVCSSSAHD